MWSSRFSPLSSAAFTSNGGLANLVMLSDDVICLTSNISTYEIQILLLGVSQCLLPERKRKQGSQED